MQHGRRHFWRRCLVTAWVWVRETLDNAGRWILLAAIVGVPTAIVFRLNHRPWGFGIGIAAVILLALSEGAYQTWREDQVELDALRPNPTLAPIFFRGSGVNVALLRHPVIANLAAVRIELAFTNGHSAPLDFSLESGEITMLGRTEVLNLAPPTTRTVLPTIERKVILGASPDIDLTSASVITGQVSYTVVFYEAGKAQPPRFRLVEMLEITWLKNADGTMADQCHSFPASSRVEPMNEP
jgi:hypothetical protein